MAYAQHAALTPLKQQKKLLCMEYCVIQFSGVCSAILLKMIIPTSPPFRFFA